MEARRAVAGVGREDRGKLPRMVLTGSVHLSREVLPGRTLRESLSHQSLLPVESSSMSMVPVT